MLIPSQRRTTKISGSERNHNKGREGSLTSPIIVRLIDILLMGKGVSKIRGDRPAAMSNMKVIKLYVFLEFFSSIANVLSGNGGKLRSAASLF